MKLLPNGVTAKDTCQSRVLVAGSIPGCKLCERYTLRSTKTSNGNYQEQKSRVISTSTEPSILRMLFSTKNKRL